jgi:hypothetical protein
MNVGDLISIVEAGKSVPLINYGHAQPDGGRVVEKELCVVLAVGPPASFTWRKIKVLGQRGNIGWTEDGLFKLISKS